jgi:uncharacterized protein YbjT (DUF2867 family)
MRVAVAGGTGLVGTYVVSNIKARGDEPVVLARETGVDLTTGAGLDAALAEVDVLIDVSNTVTTKKKDAIAFFDAGTTNLLRAGERAGVRRHVVLSVVGSDRVDFGYYLGKRHQEALALASGRPVSVLRSTQFYEFAGQLIDRSAGPVAVIPRMRIQPVAAREVAGALVELADGPLGLAPELAGPRQLELTDLARAVRDARGSSKRLLPLRLPGAVGRAMAGGALLPKGEGPRGHQTFEDWLADLAPAASR